VVSHRTHQIQRKALSASAAPAYGTQRDVQ
jgi:hypothetical protein